MVVTLGQQYNIGEKPTVIILYTYINRHAGTLENQRRQNSTSSNMVVIIQCYIGYEDEVFKEKIRTHLDLLSIPRLWGKNVVVVVLTLKTTPISTQYLLTSVVVQLRRTPSVVTG